ncbi:MAG: sugar ABC transporter substrate-binding protein, partial [Kineothrix sp.]|nr:sugar ABC transporter substrate-binding protein [Kineothrix sp.]
PEYSIAPVPDINGELLTRSLSVTNCVVVNGYSDKQELARDFARFLTSEYTDTLYSRTGKVAARYGVDYGNVNLQEFVNEYEISVPMPKMVETSNFWVELEIAFAQIWDGADVNDRLRQLSEQIMTQVTGQPYTETVIEEEEEAVDEVEYLDEEELRREAQEETEE